MRNANALYSNEFECQLPNCRQFVNWPVDSGVLSVIAISGQLLQSLQIADGYLEAIEMFGHVISLTPQKGVGPMKRRQFITLAGLTAVGTAAFPSPSLPSKEESTGSQTALAYSHGSAS